VFNPDGSPDSPRHLALAGCPNFRDAGGYRTSNGQWVRAGLVYRAGALAPTLADLVALERLDLRAVYDLRTPSEIETAPDTVPTGSEWLSFNVSGAGGVILPETTTPKQAQQYMRDGVVATATSPSALQAYHDLFTDMANRPGASVYHCTAGKDRTGWASAVLLTLLGVPQETVLADYLLSNEYYFQAPHVQAMLADRPAEQAEIFRHFVNVQPSYLQAGLDAVSEQFGSMDDYALNGLGLSETTLDKLRDKLLMAGPASANA
jgi:protein-tyrosine phosphatase